MKTIPGSPADAVPTTREGGASYALIPRHARFVAEFVIDLNATRAALAAGFSPRTATTQASRLFRKVHIQAAVRSALDARSRRAEISQDYVLDGLRREAERAGQGSNHSARVRALELLGKHVGLFDERLDQRPEVPPPPPRSCDELVLDLNKLTFAQKKAILAVLEEGERQARRDATSGPTMQASSPSE